VSRLDFRGSILWQPRLRGGGRSRLRGDRLRGCRAIYSLSLRCLTLATGLLLLAEVLRRNTQVSLCLTHIIFIRIAIVYIAFISTSLI
jgi:hypothetical protein